MKGADAPSGTQNESVIPFEVMPGSLAITTLGCPYIQAGQQFYFDYQTNTTIDNVYIVVGTQHKITPNSYDTTVNLQMVGFYGSFEELSNKFSQAQYQILEDAMAAGGPADDLEAEIVPDTE